MEPRGAQAGGFVSIWDGDGVEHKCPRIVATEILRSPGGWTHDHAVAAARRESKERPQTRKTRGRKASQPETGATTEEAASEE